LLKKDDNKKDDKKLSKIIIHTNRYKKRPKFSLLLMKPSISHNHLINNLDLLKENNYPNENKYQVNNRLIL